MNLKKIKPSISSKTSLESHENGLNLKDSRLCVRNFSIFCKKY